MTERASFLAAIHEEPEDLRLRQVFADWLEEQDDPLGEFIRVQCELEPIRLEYDNQQAERLRRREEELLDQHRQGWLGEASFLHELRWPYPEAFTFWRGLPDEVALPVRSFEEHGALLRSCCPTLRKAVAFEVNGNGAQLARCEVLSHFQALEVADWISPADARCLASSPHLRGLRTLTVWLGNREQRRVCRAFAAGLPALHQMELVQHWGGQWAGRKASQLNSRAEALAALVNELRGTAVADVHRPFEQRFPLRGLVYTDLYAGRLPDGHQALAQCGEDVLMLVIFDSTGSHLREEIHSLEGVQTHEAELLGYLGKVFGFEPGWIQIKECHVERPEGYLSVYLYDGNYARFMESPDVLPQHGSEEERRQVGARIHHWLKRGDFVICLGWDELWAGRGGYIHST